jgi:hypothetical protein
MVGGLGLRWSLRCLSLGLLLLPGCGKFFVGPGGGGTTTTCSNCIYVANFGSASVGAYSISSSGLSLVTGAPFSLGTFTTNTIVADPQFPYLYLGSAAGGVVVGFTVNSDGTLTGLSGSNGSTISSTSAQAMTMDASGSYLYILLDSTISGFGFVVQPIDTTTGLPSSSVDAQVITLPSGIIATNSAAPVNAKSQSIVVTPDGTRLYISTGGGGVVGYTLSNGLVNTAVPVVYLSNGCNPVRGGFSTYNTCYGMAVDGNSQYLMVTESGANSPGVAAFTINSNGTLSQINSTYATGSGPNAVLIDSTNTYVYVANGGISGGNSITGYSLTSLTTGTTTPTPLPGSPYSTSTSTGTGTFNGLNTIGLAEDPTQTYLMAINNAGVPDLQVYTIAASGSLTATASATSTSASNTSAAPASVTTTTAP